MDHWVLHKLVESSQWHANPSPAAIKERKKMGCTIAPQIMWTSKRNLKMYKLYCTSNAINVLTEKLLQYLKKKNTT